MQRALRDEVACVGGGHGGDVSAGGDAGAVAGRGANVCGAVAQQTIVPDTDDLTIARFTERGPANEQSGSPLASGGWVVG